MVALDDMRVAYTSLYRLPLLSLNMDEGAKNERRNENEIETHSKLSNDNGCFRQLDVALHSKVERKIRIFLLLLIVSKSNIVHV